MSITNPNCIPGCLAPQPVWDFSDCNPDFNYGQIDRIYLMALGGAPFTDWTDLSEWVARMALPVSDLDSIQFLNVIGEKPAAASTELEISRRRKITTEKIHTINFDIDETGLINYNAIRQTECGGNYRMWYGNGKYLAGDNDGIEVFINIDDVIPKDRKALELFSGKAVWENQFHPLKELNPMI